MNVGLVPQLHPIPRRRYGTIRLAGNLIWSSGITERQNVTRSRGHADTAATAEAVCTILQNGVAVGSITFTAGSQDAAFALASGLALVPSDRLELVAPATQDATLAGLALTLIGTRS